MFARIRLTRRSAGPYLASLFLLAWWLSTVLLTTGFETDPGQDVSTRLDSTAAAVRTGSLSRQVLVISLALGGLFLLAKEHDRWRALRQPLGLILAAYLAWIVASLTWTEDPSLAFRRVVAAFFIIVGAAVWGFAFYGRLKDGLSLFAKHCVILGVISIVLLWVPSLMAGEIHLGETSWSLRPPRVSEIPSSILGLSIIGALYLRLSRLPVGSGHRTSTTARFLELHLGMSVITLLALKKRTSIFAVVVVALVYALAKSSRRQRLVMLGLTAAVVVSSFTVLSSTASNVSTSAGEHALRGGDVGQAASLQGRLPLWSAVLDEALERPLQGYGYGSFWNGTQVLDRVYQEIGWLPVHAHNGYLDEILATGLIGNALLVGFFVWGLLWSLQLTRRGIDFGAVVASWIAIMLIANLTQNIFQDPFKASFFFPIAGLFALVAKERQLALVAKERQPVPLDGVG